MADPARWEAEPEPLGIEPTATGHPAVEAALARLAVLDGAPVTGHAAVYEDVHGSLTEVLAALDREDEEQDEDPPGATRPGEATKSSSTARS